MAAAFTPLDFGEASRSGERRMKLKYYWTTCSWLSKQDTRIIKKGWILFLRHGSRKSHRNRWFLLPTSILVCELKVHELSLFTVLLFLLRVDLLRDWRKRRRLPRKVRSVNSYVLDVVRASKCVALMHLKRKAAFTSCWYQPRWQFLYKRQGRQWLKRCSLVVADNQ